MMTEEGASAGAELGGIPRSRFGQTRNGRAAKLASLLTERPDLCGCRVTASGGALHKAKATLDLGPNRQ